MRVDYERTGGFAGMRMASSFDLDQLPAAEAEEVRRLLDEVGFAQLPESLTGSAPMPDQFNYRITVTADTWKHTVVTSDSSAPESLRPLLDTLGRMARQKR